MRKLCTGEVTFCSGRPPAVEIAYHLLGTTDLRVSSSAVSRSHAVLKPQTLLFIAFQFTRSGEDE